MKLKRNRFFFLCSCGYKWSRDFLDSCDSAPQCISCFRHSTKIVDSQVVEIEATDVQIYEEMGFLLSKLPEESHQAVKGLSKLYGSIFGLSHELKIMRELVNALEGPLSSIHNGSYQSGWNDGFEKGREWAEKEKNP